MNILAFSIAHDSSVCFLKNGKIDFFCKEERISKIKRDKNPFKSLEIFKEQNTTEIDEILFHTPSNYEVDLFNFYSLYVKKIFDKNLINYSILNHHLLHANHSFFNSKFKKSLVFVIDRNGSIFFVNNRKVAREAESVYLAEGNNIQPVYKSFFIENTVSATEFPMIEQLLKQQWPETEINILGYYNTVKVYESATTLINQNALENGKTMGLSAYGTQKSFPKLFDTYWKPNEKYFNQINFEKNGNLDTTIFAGFEDKIANVSKNNFHLYADKAAHVQFETQRNISSMIDYFIKKYKVDNVCFSGGYALNVLANHHYLQKFPLINFYFEPIADDSGISIGATYDFFTKNKKDNLQISPPVNNFFHFSKKMRTEKKQTGSKTIEKYLAKQLNDGKSVALFAGQSEAGPRALGNRSILFDPRSISAKEIVNKIKQREWYRPFAGAILEKHFKDYFKSHGIHKSEDMTISFECKEEKVQEIPGVIHIDNTCRVQTVNWGVLYNILQEFYNLTGCPVLLNTSFNLAGEPLVNSVDDAVKTFNESNLDIVYFADDTKIIEK